VYHKVKSTRQAENALETCIDPRRMIQLIHDVRAEHLIKRHVKGCFERACRVRRFLQLRKCAERETLRAGAGVVESGSVIGGKLRWMFSLRLSSAGV